MCLLLRTKFQKKTKKMNKSAKVTTGTILIVLVALGALAYFTNFGGFQDWISGTSTPAPTGDIGTGVCPSSGQTQFTINTNGALETTATAINPYYYIFDGNKLVANGQMASGTKVFDLACGKTYKAILLDETVRSGFYSQTLDLVGDDSSKAYNVQLYEFGQVKIVNIKNPVDPTGLSNISAGLGATKDFVIQFTENESASAYNRPLILCEVNTSSVTSVTLGGGVVSATKPSRVSTTANYQTYAWEYPKLLKSTDALVELPGKITFSSSTTPSSTDTMSCKIADQATWKKADYQILSMDEGFVTGAENSETIADVGGQDTAASTISFNNGGGY